MKRTILVVLLILLVSVPCVAQDEDVFESVESTVWSYRSLSRGKVGWSYRTRYIGFYDDSRYNGYYNSQSECINASNSYPVEYIELPGIGLFWYKYSCLRNFPVMCQWQTGVLLPLIGLGIQSCIGIPCPLQGHILKLVPNISLPEDFCPQEE